MAVLTVDGVALTDPAGLTVGGADISSEESGRNMAGEAHKDIVADKVQLDCSWPTLSWAECSRILKTVKRSGSNRKVFMSVRYPDPMEGHYVTKTFYVGDWSAPAYSLVDGRERWQGLTFTLIEK